MYNNSISFKVIISSNNLIFLLLVALLNTASCKLTQEKENNPQFRVAFYWHFLNFTWPCQEVYREAFSTQHYVPLNNVLTGIKSYKDKLYLSLPRFFPGSPVTLAALPFASSKVDPLLQPYPSWEMNVGESCDTLQNVYSMEIDSKGVMWVIDGFRINNLTNCPPKIVLLDMNKNGTVLQTYKVPSELSPGIDGWMNDLVIDESDGGYAFITETSASDPGLIVFSRKENKAWKFRDRTMFAELDAADFIVQGVTITHIGNVDGIALEPKSNKAERLLYYTALTGYDMYAISTRIVKNETSTSSSNWRKEIQYIGRRSSTTDGMIIDNSGNLYFGLLTECAIGRWNINTKPFEKHVENIYQNCTTVVWPDTFGMDTFGNLYITVTEADSSFNTGLNSSTKDRIRFRILRAHVGTKNYLYL